MGVIVLLCDGNKIIFCITDFQDTVCLNETSESLQSHMIQSHWLYCKKSLLISYVLLPSTA